MDVPMDIGLKGKRKERERKEELEMNHEEAK